MFYLILRHAHLLGSSLVYSCHLAIKAAHLDTHLIDVYVGAGELNPWVGFFYSFIDIYGRDLYFQVNYIRLPLCSLGRNKDINNLTYFGLVSFE